MVARTSIAQVRRRVIQDRVLNSSLVPACLHPPPYRRHVGTAAGARGATISVVPLTLWAEELELSFVRPTDV